MDTVSFILFVLFGLLGILMLYRIAKYSSRIVDEDQEEKQDSLQGNGPQSRV